MRVSDDGWQNDRGLIPNRVGVKIEIETSGGHREVVHVAKQRDTGLHYLESADIIPVDIRGVARWRFA